MERRHLLTDYERARLAQRLRFKAARNPVLSFAERVRLRAMATTLDKLTAVMAKRRQKSSNNV